MGEPAYKAFPRGTERTPISLRQSEAITLVALKHTVEFMRCTAVYNHGVLFIVEIQATGIEVGAAHGTKASVYHDYFCVVKAGAINPDFHAVLHQFVKIVEHAVGGEWYIAVLRDHYLYVYTALHGLAQGAFQFVVEREIRIDETNSVASSLDGVQIERADDAV